MSGVGEKRRSRFDRVESEPETKKAAIDVSAVAARAAEMSRELSSKVTIVSSYLGYCFYTRAIDGCFNYAFNLDCNGDLAVE